MYGERRFGKTLNVPHKNAITTDMKDVRTKEKPIIPLINTIIHDSTTVWTLVINSK